MLEKVDSDSAFCSSAAPASGVIVFCVVLPVVWLASGLAVDCWLLTDRKVGRCVGDPGVLGACVEGGSVSRVWAKVVQSDGQGTVASFCKKDYYEYF